MSRRPLDLLEFRLWVSLAFSRRKGSVRDLYRRVLPYLTDAETAAVEAAVARGDRTALDTLAANIQARLWPGNALVLSALRRSDEPPPGQGGDECHVWDHVDRSQLSPGGCWLWTRSVDRWGYGQYGRGRRAHRVAFEAAHGRRPVGCVCHRCDVPRCCNPDHLFEGTQGENMADRDKKRRQAFGTRNGRAKLTEDEVLEIRRVAPETRAKMDAVGSAFGVSGWVVKDVVTRKTWRHL